MDRVLVSRQPIYRADNTVLGYELLFRDSDTDRATFASPPGLTSVSNPIAVNVVEDFAGDGAPHGSNDATE